MAHADQWTERRHEGEERSNDIQARSGETVNDAPTEAIPIPTRPVDSDGDSDVERGDSERETLLASSSQRAPRSIWQDLVSGNLSVLSGDTIWRQTPTDRNR